jgi:hypothetical protein
MADIFKLGISAADCDVTVALNGFPVFRHRGLEQTGGGMPLNPLLIGAGNVLKVAVKDRGPGASLSGRITVSRRGTVVEAGGGPLALPSDDAREWRFDSEIAPLAKVLAAAMVSGEAAMRAFAVALGEAFRAGDAGTLLRLFASKIDGYAEGFGQPREAMEAALRQGFIPFLGRDPGFTEADVEAVPHCGGKVFELRRRDGSPLLSVDEADGSTQTEVFAALLPGGPAVVR